MRPEETLERLRPHLAKMGITRVANVTGLDTIGIPTVVVARPNARGLSVTQGKGPTLGIAKVSGVMEAVEHYHAERIKVSLRRAGYAELTGDANVLAPETLPRTARTFDPHARLLWIEAKHLATGESSLVPFELVHTDLSLPLPEGSGCFPITSNGLASGNTLVEAIAHALWELVERDATTLFYRRNPEEQARRRLKLDSVDDICCRELLAKYDAAGVGVAVWDVTSDVSIPVFLCQIVERELDPFRPIGMARGYGCHPRPAVALCRALCEAAQSRLTRIAGSRDDLVGSEIDARRSPEAIEYDALHLSHERFAPRSFGEVHGKLAANLFDELAWSVERLENAEFPDVYFVDLSQSEFPAHVARVLVPGLEGPSWTPQQAPSPRVGARLRKLS